jgi:hypothetical protein
VSGAAFHNLLVPASGQVVTPPPPPPPPPSRYVAGVAPGANMPFNDSRAIDFKKSADAGFSSMRTDMGWMYLEPIQGEYRFEVFERVLNDCKANNLEYVSILHTVPPWANGNSGDYGLPADKSLLENYAYVVAKHFLPLGVTKYEVGNEINLQHDGWSNDGADYARNWLPHIARGVRRASAETGIKALIIFGSLSPIWDSGQPADQFLRLAYANGAKGNFDAMAWHPYVGSDAPETSRHMNSEPDTLYNIMLSNGDDFKIWATEYGNPTYGPDPVGYMSEAAQADLAVRGIKQWYTKKYAETLFYYCIADFVPKNVQGSREDHFGFLYSDRTPKPAYDALKGILAAPSSGTTLEDLYAAQSPVLHIPCNSLTDGIKDKSGHGHNASIIGTPTLGSAPNGLGSAIRFNDKKTGDTLVIPNHTDLSINTTRKFSFALWMCSADMEFTQPPYLRQGTAEKYIHLIGKGDTGQDEWLLRQYPASDSERSRRRSIYTFNLVGGLGTGAYYQPKTPRHIPQAGEWTFVSGECDMTVLNWAYPGIAYKDKKLKTIDPGSYPGWVRMYTDGILRDIDPLANYMTVPKHGADPMRIGSCSPDSYFPGWIWQVIVCNHLVGARNWMKMYRSVYNLQKGVGGLKRAVGGASSQVAGNVLQMNATGPIAVGEVGIVGVYGEYFSSEPTITDQRGNVWKMYQSVAMNANTAKITMYRCQPTAAILAGDWIKATFSSGITRKVMAACSVTGIAGPVAIDKQEDYTSKSMTDTSENPSHVEASECPWVVLTTGTAKTVIVSALGLQASGVTTHDDPEAWGLGGQVGTTGGGVNVDMQLTIGVRSVPAQGDYTFGATSTTPGRWVGVATSFVAG